MTKYIFLLVFPTSITILSAVVGLGEFSIRSTPIYSDFIHKIGITFRVLRTLI